MFEVARRIELLALDERLGVLRQRLLWVLGLGNHAAADRAVTSIAWGTPLLLLGPPGCEQRAIAEEIHRRSPVAERGFIDVHRHLGDPVWDEATPLGTVFVDLTRTSEPLPRAVITRAFAYGRPIIAAESEERAAACLDDNARQLDVIPRATPADRPDDIPRLLEALVVQEHARLRQTGTSMDRELLPLAALGESNVEALRTHTWPGHFEELREQARRLHAVLTSGLRARAAARALGLGSVSSLTEALAGIGVHLATHHGDDRPLDDSRDRSDLPTPPSTSDPDPRVKAAERPGSHQAPGPGPQPDRVGPWAASRAPRGAGTASRSVRCTASRSTRGAGGRAS